jgi:hypothetical protein
VTRMVDLDDAAGLELAWQELSRRRAVREIDPPLREAILRRCERLPSSAAASIRADLDELHPAVVLETHFGALIPKDMPTVGAVRRRREAAR